MAQHVASKAIGSGSASTRLATKVVIQQWGNLRKMDHHHAPAEQGVFHSALGPFDVSMAYKLYFERIMQEKEFDLLWPILYPFLRQCCKAEDLHPSIIDERSTIVIPRTKEGVREAIIKAGPLAILTAVDAAIRSSKFLKGTEFAYRNRILQCRYDWIPKVMFCSPHELQVLGYFGGSVLFQRMLSNAPQISGHQLMQLMQLFETASSYPECPPFQELLKNYEEFYHNPGKLEQEIDRLTVERTQWLLSQQSKPFDLFFQCLTEIYCFIDSSSLRIKDNNDNDKDDVEKGMASIAHILGIPYDLLLHLLYLNANGRHGVERREEYLDNIRHWSNIRKGRDVFIKGLGSFHVGIAFASGFIRRSSASFVFKQNELGDDDEAIGVAAGDSVEQRLHRMEAMLSRMIDAEIFTSFPTDVPSAVMESISLTQLRVFGYFGETIFSKAAESSRNHRTILDALIKIFRTGLSHPDCPQYLYLIKHYQYWNHPDHIGSIDELDAARMRWMEAPNHTMDPNDWPVNAMNMKPRELLNVLREAGRKKAMAPIERYTYLDELQDHNDVRVLRTNHDIIEAAKALHNCAADYTLNVETGESVLLVQMDDRKKKPIAMAMADFVCVTYNYSQVYGPNNRQVSKTTQQRFDEYAEEFLKPFIDKVARYCGGSSFNMMSNFCDQVKDVGPLEVFHFLDGLIDDGDVKVVRSNHSFPAMCIASQSENESMLYSDGQRVLLRKTNSDNTATEAIAYVTFSWTPKGAKSELVYNPFPSMERLMCGHNNRDCSDKQSLFKPFKDKVLSSFVDQMPRSSSNILLAGKLQEPRHLDRLVDDGNIKVIRSNHEMLETVDALRLPNVVVKNEARTTDAIILVDNDDEGTFHKIEDAVLIDRSFFNAVAEETSVWIKQVNEKNEPIAIAEATNMNTTGDPSPFLSFMCGAGGDPVVAKVREELDTYVKKYL